MKHIGERNANHEIALLARVSPFQAFPGRLLPLGDCAARVYKDGERGARPEGSAPRLFYGAGRFFAARAKGESGKRMVNPFTFLQEVRAEANKVTWPTRRETMITTGLVILMVLFASLFFVLVDSALRFIVGLLLRAGQ